MPLNCEINIGKNAPVRLLNAVMERMDYVKEKADENAVYEMLREMCNEGICGISEMLTCQEAEKRYGLSGKLSFVVESDSFTSFHSDWRAPAVRSMERSDYRYGRAAHGHMPEKGPQPPMIVSGPAFQSNVALDSASILDEAPTLQPLWEYHCPMQRAGPFGGC